MNIASQPICSLLSCMFYWGFTIDFFFRLLQRLLPTFMTWHFLLGVSSNRLLNLLNLKEIFKILICKFFFPFLFAFAGFFFVIPCNSRKWRWSRQIVHQLKLKGFWSFGWNVIVRWEISVFFLELLPGTFLLEATSFYSFIFSLSSFFPFILFFVSFCFLSLFPFYRWNCRSPWSVNHHPLCICQF